MDEARQKNSPSPSGTEINPSYYELSDRKLLFSTSKGGRCHFLQSRQFRWLRYSVQSKERRRFHRREHRRLTARAEILRSADEIAIELRFKQVPPDFGADFLPMELQGAPRMNKEKTHRLIMISDSTMAISNFKKECASANMWPQKQEHYS